VLKTSVACPSSSTEQVSYVCVFVLLFFSISQVESMIGGLSMQCLSEKYTWGHWLKANAPFNGGKVSGGERERQGEGMKHGW